MSKKDFTLTSKILLHIVAAGSVAMPFVNPYKLRNKVLFGRDVEYEHYRQMVYYLARKGFIKIVDKNAQKFLKLTKAGKLEALIAKAKIPNIGKWDGKWRLFIFDIPEEARDERQKLRFLLKSNNFRKLQASVFISPYPLNRDAIKYLKTTGLISYIRIMKIEEMDDDRDLKKQFSLK